MSTLNDRQRWCRAVIQQNQTPQQLQHVEVIRNTYSTDGRSTPARGQHLDSRLFADDPHAVASSSADPTHSSPLSVSPAGLLHVRNGAAADAVPGASTHFISDAKRFSPHIGGATTRAELLRRQRRSAPTVVAKHGRTGDEVRSEEEQRRAVSPVGALFVSPLKLEKSHAPAPRTPQPAATGSPPVAGRRSPAASRRAAQNLSQPPAEKQAVPRFMQPLIAARRMHELSEEELSHRALATTPFSTSIFGLCRGSKIHPTSAQLEWTRPFAEQPHSRAVQRIVATSHEKRVRLLQQAHHELNAELGKLALSSSSSGAAAAAGALAVSAVVSQEKLLAQRQQPEQGALPAVREEHGGTPARL